MADIKNLIVKATKIKDWFTVIDAATNAKEIMIEYLAGHGEEKKYRLYEVTKIGFCVKDHCTGVDPADALARHIKEKSPEIMVTIKSIF